MLPTPVMAGTVIIRVDDRIVRVLSNIEACADKTPVQVFDREYKKGWGLFFQQVKPVDAIPHLYKAIQAWSVSKCAFLNHKQLTRIARAYVLTVRALVLKKQLAQAVRIAQQGLMDLGAGIFRTLAIPPDISAFFTPQNTDRAKLRVRVYRNRDMGCVFFANGIEFSKEVDLPHGTYTLFVRCGDKVTWMEDIYLTADTSVSVAVDIPGFVRGIKKDGHILSSAEDADKLLNRLAFCMSTASFFVDNGSGPGIWKSHNGRWGPRSESVRARPKTEPSVKKLAVRVKPRKKLRILPIVLASVAAAAAVGGGVMNYLSNQATDRINSGYNELDKRKAYMIGAWTAYGTATALGITAVVLWSVRGTHKTVHASVTPNGISFSMGF